jgi:hypothetical protein
MADYFKKVSVNEPIQVDRGSATDVSQAATVHKPMGQVTSSTTDLAADTSETLTITNKHCKSDSLVLCEVSTSGTGTPVVSSVVPSNGLFTVVVRNVAPATALNAAYKVRFAILNAVN